MFNFVAPSERKELHMSAHSTGRPDLKDASRKHAWLRVKTAVRTYSSDPTRCNAEEVEAAWKLMRRIDTVSDWRELQGAAPERTVTRD